MILNTYNKIVLGHDGCYGGNDCLAAKLVAG